MGREEPSATGNRTLGKEMLKEHFQKHLQNEMECNYLPPTYSTKNL